MLFLSPKFLMALATVRVAVAIPLGISYDKTTGLTQDEIANKGRLDAATVQADAQVTNMRTALDRMKSGQNDANAKAMYKAAFGEHAKLSFDDVDKTVSALQTGTLSAKLETHPFTGGEIAAVPWTKVGKTPWTPGDAQFSAQFHGQGANALNNDGRAGTVIHEATHQLMKTGDDVNKSGNIIKPYDGTSIKSGADGYTSNDNMHKTIADVNADTTYTAVRDSAANMHHNAESYAVFASLCSQPGALRRRDVHLYNRALFDGDDDQLAYLARRNSCELPPDYFAKKAAARKAAAAKEGAKAQPESKVAPANAHNVNLKTASSKAIPHPKVEAGKAAKGPSSKAAVKSTSRASKASHLKVNTHAGKTGAKVSKIGHVSKAGGRSSKSQGSVKGGRVAHGAKAAHLTKARTAVKGAKVAKSAHSRVAKSPSRLTKSRTAAKGVKAHPQAHSRVGKSTSRSTAAKGVKARPLVHHTGKATSRLTKSKAAGKSAHSTKAVSKSKSRTPVKGGKAQAHSRVGKTLSRPTKSKAAVKGGKAQAHSHAKSPSRSTKSKLSVKASKGRAAAKAPAHKSNTVKSHVGKVASHATQARPAAKGGKPAVHAAKAARPQVRPQSQAKKVAAKAVKPAAPKAAVKVAAKVAAKVAPKVAPAKAKAGKK